MLLNLLVSLCCVIHVGDTIDVATVSSDRNAAVVSLSPVQTITGSTIEKLGAIELQEAVRQFSGVSIKDYGGIGGLKTVSVRNMGASHTAVIYDGIAISDAQNGQVDISRFNLDDISSISMAIGQEDNIFCNARQMNSAGTLRIESVMPTFDDGPTGVNARMTFGSFGTYNPHITLKQQLGRAYAMKASLHGTFSEGNYPFLLKNGQITTIERRINSDIKSYGAEADFYADWKNGGRLKAKANCYSSERGLPGSVVLYTQNAFERLWNRSIISNIMYDNDLGSQWKLHADLGFSSASDRHLDTDPAYPEPQDSRYTQNEYSAAVRTQYSPVSGLKFVIAEDLFCNTLASNIPECVFPVRINSISALSAQYEGHNIRASVSLTGTYITESLQIGRAPTDRRRLSPMVGLSWRFHEKMRLRMSYKEGFRVPTFNDLYYARVGNRNLKPETARQFNLGLTYTGSYSWGKIDLTADAYQNLIKDKIVAVPTMFIWKMQNVGEVSMFGTDVTASVLWKTFSWLNVHASANYSLQYALDITDPASKSYRHQITYTPRHCGNANFTLETTWVNISYRMSACGKRYIKNQNIPSNAIAGYADHCLSLNREFNLGKKHPYKLLVSLEGLNLADNNYEIIHYYPMPGRSYRLTLRCHFD